MNLFGLVGVFDSAEAVRRAAARLRAAGFRAFDAYTPYPVEGLDDIVHPGAQLFLPLLMFAAAIVGAAWGFWIQYWDEVLNYPLNVGGRPFNSWPAFIVGAFEFMLLVTVTAGFVGMLARSGLPKLYHPIFEASGFHNASRDRFVICIEATDPRYDGQSLRVLLRELGAEQIEEVRA